MHIFSPHAERGPVADVGPVATAACADCAAAGFAYPSIQQTRGNPWPIRARTIERITPLKRCRKSAQDAAQRTAEELRKSAEDASRKTAGGAAELSRSALDAGERAALSGAELIQRNSEVMRRAWHSYLDMAAQMTGQSSDELARAFPLGNLIGGEETRKAAEQSSRNVDAIVDTGNVLAKGAEDITREWFDFARSRVEHNLVSLSEFTKCRSPQHVAAVQSELMRDNLEVVLQISRKVAEISVRVAEDAMGKVAAATDKGRHAA